MDSPEDTDRLLLRTQGMSQLIGRVLGAPVPQIITFLSAMCAAIENSS